MATIEELDALKKAYASGVKRVTYGDKTVEYRSLSEMSQVIDTIEQQVCPEAARHCRRQYASVSMGY